MRDNEGMVERIRTCPDPQGWAQKLLANSREMPNGCIEWTGPIDPRPRPKGGYGRFKIVIDGKRRETGAHRAAWLVWCGDIPGDLMPDHLCRNSPCINVKHMELVTNAVNGQRGDHSGKKGHSGRRRGALYPQGCGKHGLTDGYEHTMRDGYTRWVCRICAGVARDAYRARQRAA